MSEHHGQKHANAIAIEELVGLVRQIKQFKRRIGSGRASARHLEPECSPWRALLHLGGNQMERKATQVFGTKVDGRVVTGFASIFGVLDSYRDITHNGAFTKTLQENRSRVKHLWQHESWTPPIATIKDIREVGRDELPDEVQERFPEATGGLLVMRQYLDTPRADEILAGIKADPPAITELSFGYDTVKADYQVNTEEMSIRHLREVRLYDTSDVNWGANQATTNIKGQDRRLVDLADQVQMILASDAVKEGRVLSKRNITKLKDALAMLQEVLTAAEPPEESDDDTKALTVQALLQQVAIAEREFALILG